MFHRGHVLLSILHVVMFATVVFVFLLPSPDVSRFDGDWPWVLAPAMCVAYFMFDGPTVARRIVGEQRWQ